MRGVLANVKAIQRAGYRRHGELTVAISAYLAILGKTVGWRVHQHRSIEATATEESVAARSSGFHCRARTTGALGLEAGT